ncbi:MAG: flagellar motor switch protein FliN [Spirochaetaceae bacterium]|jgi:flagellar motor switch protein FliN/FliY|nr:flagellar motor switch protein FliN [Spirochaetaceae bacterium]
MSDGALSQAEIDALLGGAGGGAAAAPKNAASGGAGDISALKDCLNGTLDAQSSNVSAMTGSEVKFGALSLSSSTRDAFLAELPDTVTSVKIDFTSGFPGEHIFLMSEDTAKAIASLMNKEENPALDEMAMSVIGEVISQMTGTEITALTNKTGNKSIASASPEAANVAKATAPLPSDTFVTAEYDLFLGAGTHKIWEIFGTQTASGIAAAIRAASAPPPQSPTQGMGGVGGGAMGGMGAGGFGGVFTQTPGVQPVQFPGLTPALSQREQGNIGLLMDVFMEMTVELGRTRKLIKEILSMGEGTIIELDKLAGEPVDILVNHVPIAKGEVVVIDENFGVRVTEIVSPAERMGDIG